MRYENEARVCFTAISANESFARIFAAGFLSLYDPTVNELEDVKTAVSEAVTNAVIHGYEEREGMVELFCGILENILYIMVADKGTGIADIEEARRPLYTSKPEMERSGMGFTIMETFMDQVTVESAPEKGTRIYMKKRLSKG